jgi:hypothetical protein
MFPTIERCWSWKTANVYLEEIGSPKSKRRPEELRRFDGEARLSIRDCAQQHAISQTKPAAPCISDVTRVFEGRDQLQMANLPPK